MVDLTKIALEDPGEDYGRNQQRAYALDYLKFFAEKNPKIPKKFWPIIVRAAEQMYWTTFTDDSGYIPGRMDFTPLDNLPKNIRNEVVNVLYGGNWITQGHLDDYLLKPDSYAHAHLGTKEFSKYHVSKHVKIPDKVTVQTPG